MDELLAQVSAQTGVPVDMLERAARARAGAAGTTAEAVVAGWAGAPVPESGGASPAPSPAPAPAEAAAAPAAAEAPSLGVEVLEPSAEPAAPPPEPMPEPQPEPEPVGPGLPRWLTAAFVIVPFIAVLYALSVPNGPDCGSAGRLDVDPVTGVAVNCDGSEFGSTAVDYFALGETVFQARCSACHGATGGGGAGPALANGAVVATFSSCSDHVQWVTLGSAGWPDATYGDTNKPVGVGMPGFGSIIASEEELRSAVLYERVAFGGLDVASVEADCGLVTAAALGQ